MLEAVVAFVIVVLGMVMFFGFVGAKLIQQLCTRLDRMQDELAEIKACVKRIADAATKPPMDELSERVQQTAMKRIQGRAMERAPKKLND